jgi:hypothetical protein
MDTHDDSLRSSEGEDAPLIPHLDSLELSDDEIRRLQAILNASGGEQFNFTETKYRGFELLRITLMLLDPKGYEHHLWNPLLPPGFPMSPPSPDPAPIPQRFPINLEADHPREIERALKMLAEELRLVKRRPTHWRWALVVLYNALGHTLAARRPATFLPYTGIGQLTKMFDAVAGEQPELLQVRDSVKTIDRLRTTYITWGVTRWPIGPSELPGMFLDSLGVIRSLEPPIVLQLTAVEEVLNRLAANPPRR